MSKLKFGRYTRNNILMSILMVILGLLLFFWPGKTLELAAKLLGIALLVGAAVSAWSWFKDRSKPGASYGTLALAILCLVVGLIILIAPRGVVSLLPKLIGVAIIVNGVLNLAQALELKNAGNDSWVSSLVMAVLTILLGLFLLFFAFSLMKTAIMIIGGILVYNGASNLWIESRYRKMGK